MSDTREACVACGTIRTEGKTCCEAAAYALGSRYAMSHKRPPEWEGMSQEFKAAYERGENDFKREYEECYGEWPYHW